ncbi:hypothetical protein D3C84_637380 [compost metagenome]
MEVQAQLEARRGHQQAQQAEALEDDDDQAVGVAEQDGGGLHADAQVVVAVGDRVVGVVGHRPQQVGQVQQAGRCRQAAGLGGEGHQDAPGIGRAEHHLRVVGVALHERVERGQRQGAARQPHGGGVGQQHQHEGHRHQRGEHQQRLAWGDPPAGQRTLAGALDVAVDAAVGEVVDRAAGRAGEDHAEGEDQQVGQRRHAACSDPQRGEGRPQQQVDADRPVQARQVDEVLGARVQAGQGLEQGE